MKNNAGQNLLFLISQPRAGSTLLQRILGGHPDIHTTAEPWIMLHQLYALKHDGYRAEYEPKLARAALEDFLKTLPEGEEAYIKAVRTMSLQLYRSALARSGKKLFLDKTPRYYFIIPELRRVFPEASFIFLLRNPLAVLSSILETWVKNRGQPFAQYAHDLLKAPRLIADALDCMQDRAIIVHYEDLVENPEKETALLCKGLRLAFYPQMIHYGNTPPPKGRLGDDAGIHKHTAPVSDSLDTWPGRLASSPEWDVAQAYLSYLAPDLLSRLGYSLDHVRDDLSGARQHTSPGDPRAAQKLLSQIGLDAAPAKPFLRSCHRPRTKPKEKPDGTRAQIMATSAELLSGNRPPYLLPSELKAVEAISTQAEPCNSDAVLHTINSLCTRYMLHDEDNKNTGDFIALQEKIFDYELQSSTISLKNYQEQAYLISAIVSTYNDEAFMQECLADLENQTVADRLEIIVIDAASRQNEAAVVEKFQQKHTNIQYVRTPHRIGVYAAWNIALRRARGTYITPFSTNDRLSPRAYETLCGTLDTHPDIALVYGDTYVTDVPHETFENHTASKIVPRNFTWPDYSYEELLHRPLVGPHPMWRKSVHAGIGYFDEHYSALGDQDFWLRLGEKYRLLHVPEYTGLYWWSDNALSCNTKSRIPQMEEADIREKYNRRYALRNRAGENSSPPPPPGPGKKVSVIIPVWNNAELTKNCLVSLSENTRYGDYEVIIIDNNSTDETPDLLKGLSGNVRTITNSENAGFAKANNQGAAVAAGEYLLFLNNDTRVEPGWMEQLVRVLENDPDVSAAGSKLLYPDGSIQHAGVIIVDDIPQKDPLKALNRYRGQPDAIADANLMKTFQCVTGACLMVRKSCFMQAGGFHEGYLNGYEDVDLCFKLQEMGRKLVYQPDSRVVHYESQSGPERFASARENIDLLHHRWLGKVHPDYRIEPDGAHVETGEGKIGPYSCPAKTGAGVHAVLVSIIIPAYNQVAYTRACIESIKRHTPEPHEIIVVDNGSTDGTRTCLENRRDPGFLLITNETNQGFARACNQGIKAATGEFLVILNNDTMVTDGWIRGLITVARGDTRIGMVGPVSNFVGSTDQFDRPAPYNDLEGMEAHADALRRDNTGKYTYVDRLIFFCVLIKRRLVDSIGLLDESYELGNYEDDDFCWRARSAGWRMAVAPHVFIHHFGSKTFAAHQETLDHDRLMQINAERFCTKWDIDPAWYEKTYIKRPPAHLLVETDLGPFTHNGDASPGGIPGTVPRDETYMPAETTEKAADSAPDLLRQGEVLFEQGDLEGAASLFLAAIACDPMFAEAHNNLGVVYWQQGQGDRARDHFRKAFEINPEDINTVNNLSDVLIAQKHYTEAERVCGAFSEHNPHAASILQKLRTVKQAVTEPDVPDKSPQAGAARQSAPDDQNSEHAPDHAPHTEPRQPAEPPGRQPEISVVIATYNRSDVIRACLEALQVQTFSRDDFEVIVCDDGSSDDTKAVVREFNAPFKLRYLCQDNCGPASARNMGITHATGRYVLFLDDDCFPLPECLEKHYETHKAHSQEKHAVLGMIRTLPAYAASWMGYILDNSDLLLECPLMQEGITYDFNYFFTGNISISRRALLDAEMFDENFTGTLWGAEDIDLGYRLFLQGHNIIFNKEAMAWHAQANSPESFCTTYKRRGGGAVRMFTKYPELKCHYEDISIEAVNRWRHYDDGLEDSISQLRCVLGKINEIPVPDGLTIEKPLSGKERALCFQQQWILDCSDLRKTAERLLSDITTIHTALTAESRRADMQDIAEGIYEALNFLKWHYDTIGITASPWIEECIHIRSNMATGVEKSPSSKIYGNHADRHPQDELFRRKLREGNLPWNSYWTIAGLLLNQIESSSNGHDLASEAVCCLERIFELKPYYTASLELLMSLYGAQNRTADVEQVKSAYTYMQALSSGNGKKAAGYEYLTKGDDDKALLCFGESLRENSADVEAALEVVNICMHKTMLDTADKMIQHLGSSFNGDSPFSYMIWQKWAELEFIRGNYERAADLCKQSIEKHPNPLTMNLLGQTQLKRGLSHKAAAHWRRSLGINPYQIPLYLKLFDCVQGSVTTKRSVDEAEINILMYSFNKVDLFRQTVERLAKTDIGRAGIIMLNNNSSDGTRAFLETAPSLFPDNRVTVINLPTNIGAPAARNWLLKQPENRKTEFLAYLDDDVIMPENWLQVLVDTLDSYPAAAIAGGKIVNQGSPKTIQYVFRYLDLVADEQLRLSNMHPYELDFGQFDFTRKCLSVMGCCHLLRTDIAMDVGEFDIRFSPSQIDDIDHDLLTALGGHEIIYNGHLEVVHCQKAGKEAFVNRAAFGNVQGNDYKFAMKHDPRDMVDLKARTEESDRQDIRNKITLLRREGFLEGVPEISFEVV